MRWAIGALIITLIGVIVWAVVTDNRWTTRCHREGGTVEERYEGIIPTQVGKVLVPRPHYSEHCWVDGREVSV